MQLPIPYDWFVLVSRLTIGGLFVLFLWQLLRALARDALVSPGVAQLQLSPLNGSRPILLRRSRPTVVGRDDDCDVVIPDPSISGRHARIAHDGAEWLLTDLGSTNGTWLNGARLAAPAPIEAFDVVQFGRFDVRVMVADADDDVIGLDRAGKR